MEAEISMTKKHAKQMLAAALAAGDEVVIQLTKDRLSFHQMDPSQISMSVFDAPSSWFSRYEVKLPEGKDNILVQLDAVTLDRFISKAGENLSIGFRENKVVGESMSDGVMKKFEMNTLDTNGSTTLAKEPTIKTTSKITMKKALFRDVINETTAMSGSGHVRLELEKGSFVVTAAGAMASSNMKLDKTNGVQVESEGDFSVCFPANYLTDLLGGMGEKICVNLGKSMPMVIRDASDKGITTPMIVAYLAPRISDDEDIPEKTEKKKKNKKESSEDEVKIETDLDGEPD